MPSQKCPSSSKHSAGRCTVPTGEQVRETLGEMPTFCSAGRFGHSNQSSKGGEELVMEDGVWMVWYGVGVGRVG